MKSPRRFSTEKPPFVPQKVFLWAHLLVLRNRPIVDDSYHYSQIDIFFNPFIRNGGPRNIGVPLSETEGSDDGDGGINDGNKGTRRNRVNSSSDGENKYRGRRDRSGGGDYSGGGSGRLNGFFSRLPGLLS